MLTPEEIMDARRFPRVGKCIYCGSVEDLTDEHVLPLGLSGTAVLPDASCKECAKITGRFEQDVLRGPMQQVRVFRELKSRTKHRDAPKTKELQIATDDSEAQPIGVGFTEGPVVYTFPVFEVPAFVLPEGYAQGIRLKGFATCAFGKLPEEVMKEQHQAQSMSWSESHRYTSFARMLAKIGYANAFGRGLEMGVVDPFPQIPPIVSSILGTTDDIGMWVGTFPKPPEIHEGVLHRINLSTLSGREDILVTEVQIFADSETPCYGVILGQSNLKLTG